MKKRYPAYITDYIKAFGRNVKKLRLEQNLTQEQLANLAEVERNQIYRLEKGHHGATLTTIVSVAAALGKQTIDLHRFHYELPIVRESIVPASPKKKVNTTELVHVLVFKDGFFDSQYRAAGDVVKHYLEKNSVKLRSSPVSGVLRILYEKKILDRVPGRKKGTFLYIRAKL